MVGKREHLPLIVLERIVVFPGTIFHFDVSKDKNFAAVEKALTEGVKVVVLSRSENLSKTSDCYEIGVLCNVRQLIKISGKSLRVMVEGIQRIGVDEIDYNGKYFIAITSDIESCFEDEIADIDRESMLYGIKDLFEIYANESKKINANVVKKVKRGRDLEKLIDYIASNAPIGYEKKYTILNSLDLKRRYDMLVKYIADEIQMSRIRNEFQNNVKKLIDENQKEYYLREQLRAIREELGDTDSESEADVYSKKCSELNASDEVKEKLYEEIKRFRTVSSSSSESAVIRGYIETILALPWENVSEDNNSILNVEKTLDRNHYGLKKVKERIVESLAVRQLTGKGETPIICLVGPPGTGKTSIAKSVAEALNKKYIRICLGGVRDEAEIRGHRKTYVGAMPGRIAEALKKAKVSNPLILLDEIDKVSNDYKGDTFSALLEVLDPEQNEFFTDHYVEVPINLSNVLFICTANSTQTIPGPLLDRMEIIEVSSYTQNEKYHIAKKYLVNKQKIKNGLQASMLSISDSAINSMILNYTREAGVRNLERCIARICRKAAKQIVSEQNKSVKVNGKNLEDYLGKIKYTIEEINKKPEIGIVRGLAWTSVGGDTLEIEVNIMRGKGKFELTGQMGDVMKESAMTAISYVRSCSDKYSVSEKFFEENDIHIHIPEGAVPKDGPSAGITMATAIMSAVTGKYVRSDIAMTGEITLRGRVLPIGGLKEKVLAAKNAKVKLVLVPEKNEKDINEIEKEITDGIEIVYVNNMEQVLDKAFVKDGSDVR